MREGGREEEEEKEGERGEGRKGRRRSVLSERGEVSRLQRHGLSGSIMHVHVHCTPGTIQQHAACAFFSLAGIFSRINSTICHWLTIFLK